MRWDRVECDDGDGYWLEFKFPGLGELCIDDLNGHWALYWFNGIGDQPISTHQTEADAKVAGADWLRLQATRIENALAAGFVPVDDGN